MIECSLVITRLKNIFRGSEMSFISCGCKICKSNLGEHTNGLANENYSLKEIIENLKSQGLNVDKKVILRHLNVSWSLALTFKS